MTTTGLPMRADAISLEPPGLRGLLCARCGRRSFPARELCPHCGSEAIEQIALAGHGRVVSWTVVHQAPPPLQTPYTLVTVDLDDGVRLLGAVADRVEIGSEVTVELFPMKTTADGEALWWYRFRAAEEQR
ncbi:MAG: Zn-ribbon domain-containing OB-fold protein [Mycobacterium sp.]